MKLKNNPFAAAALALVSLSLSGQHAQAADRIWSNATGTWDTSTANWSGAVFANGDNAIFSSATGNSALTLGASVNPLNLRSNGANTPATTTITGAEEFTLTLGNGTAGTGNITALNGSSAYEQNLTYTLPGATSDFALMAGSGTSATPAIWNIASTKTFSIAPGTNGPTFDLNGNTVNLTGAGTVLVTGGGVTVTSTGNPGVINVNSGILRFNAGGGRNIAVDGTVAVNVASGAEMEVAYNTGGGSTFEQALTLNGGTLERTDPASSHSVDFGGTITLGAGGGIIRNPGGALWKIGSPISGSSPLTFNAGTIQLTGTSNYTGNTNLTGGRLILSNANNLSGGTFTVSGGTLELGHGGALGSDSVLVDGNGAIVSVNNGLTVDNPLTLKRGASSRAILSLGDGATWSGDITADNTNVTTANYAYIEAGGLSAETASIVSGDIGFTVLGTPSSASPTFVFRRSDRFGKVTGPVSLSNGYVQLLDPSKWEFSNDSNSWGTLDISNAGAVVTVGAENTLPPGGVVTSTSTLGGTLLLNDQAETAAYDQTIAGLGGNVNVGLLTGTATLTLDTTSNQSCSGLISGEISLVKSGAAKQTLTGFNNYTGSTTINGGTLALGSTGALPVSDLSISNATLDLRKGTDNRTQFVNDLTLSNATLEIGLGPSVDQIDALAATVSGNNTLKLHGSVEPGTYDLIVTQDPLPESFTLDTSNVLGGGFNTYAGTVSGTNYVLTVGGSPTPATAYWHGDVSDTWNDASVAPGSNWAADDAGATDTAQLPGPTTDVVFSTSGADNTDTTLGRNFSIQSLTFESGSSGIGGANTLDIQWVNWDGYALEVADGATATLNTAGTTFTGAAAVQAGGTLTVNGGGLGTGPLTVDGTLHADMNLTTGPLGGAGSISRSTTGTSALTVSSSADSTFAGSIANGSGTVSLNKTGTGTLTLSGASTFSGGTTISHSGGAGNGIVAAHAEALGTGPVLVNGGQNFNGSLVVNPGLTVANALTLKRGNGGSNRAVLDLGSGSTWSGGINVDNTSGSGIAVILARGNNAANASIVSGNIGYSVLGTPATGSPTLVLRQGNGFGKVTGSISLSTTGYLQTLDSSNWEFNNASNTWGTLDIAHANAIVTTGAANTLSSTGVVYSTVGGTLRLNNQAGGTAHNQSIAGLSGNVNVGLATGAATLTVNTTANQSSSGVISGAISLVKTGAANQTLSGVNTYTGDTTVNGGTLILADNARLRFVPGANGVSNRLKGTGTVELLGDFNIDLSGADLTDGNSWTLVDVGTLSEVFLSSFQVVGFTETANVHTLVDGANTWTFTEATGVLSLSVAGGYDSWAASKGLTGADAAFDADPDNDGIDNGLEFVLGGEPNPATPGSNSAALLPTVSQSSGDLIFTFKRKDISESGVALKFQWSTDLSFPSPANDVPIGAVSSTTDTITVDVTEDDPDADTDTIVITVPAAKAAGGKLFGRLNAVKAP